MFILVSGTPSCIHDALYSSKSKRNLLRFKVIHRSEFHIETICENNIEYLCITSSVSGQNRILEKLLFFLFDLYYTMIKSCSKLNSREPKIFVIKKLLYFGMIIFVTLDQL